MSSESAPAAPDYTPIAQASEAASAQQTQLAQEQLDWAKQQYAQNEPLTQQVTQSLLTTQDQANSAAAQDRAQYEDTYVPLENQQAAEAAAYASPQQTTLNMGKAQATTSQAFDAARANSTRDLEAYGVDPSATRFGALDIGARTQQAAAVAGAGNTARDQTFAEGQNLISNAINVGRGLPTQATAEQNTAGGAGTGAVNATNSTTGVASQTMGTPVQYLQGANSALNTWGNTLNQGYQNELGEFNANQNASSGVGSAVGLAAGLFLADGGAVPDGVTPGGAVPVSASPSGGSAVDDVPSALTVGEFVMPKDVTSWYGEEKMHKMIEKARQQRLETTQQTGAVPTVRPSAIQRPTFVSRPGALPVQQMQRAA